MARLPRLVVPGQAHHLVQRGNNGQPVFIDDDDRRECLRLLAEAAAVHKVAVHAYALLNDHFRLLVTPQEAAALSLAMQSLGRRYVAAFNRRHRRSGTLWEGRFRGGVVEPGTWLLAAMVFLDSAPVATGCAVDATVYAWSSAGPHLGLRRDSLITDHPSYWALGNTPFDRQAAYRHLLDQGLDTAQTAQLDAAAQRSWALGSDDYLRQLQADSLRPMQPRPRGRPRRSADRPA